jgi:hypothetical protein
MVLRWPCAWLAGEARGAEKSARLLDTISSNVVYSKTGSFIELAVAFRQRQIENDLLPEGSKSFCPRSRAHSITAALEWFLNVEHWKQEGHSLYERRLFGVWLQAAVDAKLSLEAKRNYQPTVR